MFTVSDIIDIAVRLERNGADHYRQALQLPLAEEIKTLLRWMIDEENDHRQWFMQLKNEQERHHSDDLIAIQTMNQEILDDFIGKQTFSLAEVDFEQIEDTRDLIQVFIEFEQDTILFYEMLQSFITDKPVAAKLAEIIDQEKQHVAQLRKMTAGPRVGRPKKDRAPVH